MGDYLTTTEVENHIGTTRLARLTNETAGGSVVTARVTEAIDRGQGVIDSALATRDWKTPINLTTFPKAGPVLQWANKGLSVYELHGRAEVTPDSVVKDRDDVQAWLDKIVEGKADLPVDTELTETAASTGMTLESTESVANRSTMGRL